MNKHKSRTSLVLMELIITILFFSLASAVCVQLFVKAHLITKETNELNNAVNICQSICEVMNGTDGSIDSIQNYFPTAVGDDDYFVIYFDEDFNETLDMDTYVYAADVTIDSVGKLYNMDVLIKKKPNYDVIYSIRSSKYIQ